MNKMKTETQHYSAFIKEILNITKNCEGYGASSAIESLITEYQGYFDTTPIPVSIGKWIEDLFDLLDNCEGAGLERELRSLKAPKTAK